MGMDFSTQETFEEVDVFQLDDLAQSEYEIATQSREANQGSVFSSIAYWIGELRWRAKYWGQTRK